MQLNFHSVDSCNKSEIELAIGNIFTAIARY